MDTENTRHSITRAEVAAIRERVKRYKLWEAHDGDITEPITVTGNPGGIVGHATMGGEAVLIALDHNDIPRLIDALEMAWEALEICAGHCVARGGDGKEGQQNCAICCPVCAALPQNGGE